MIFGVTRFSVFSPSSNAWKSSREMTEDRYREYLFSERRLASRLLIMERFSVPILAKMSNRNESYHHFITYSEDLPEKFKTALFSLCDSFNNLHVVDHRFMLREMKKIIRSSDKCSGTYALFNLDDDDLVAVDYVDHLDNFVNPKFNDCAVSFGLGISSIFDQDGGVFRDFRECYQPKINIGLALINRYEISDENVDIGSLTRPSHTIIDRERTLVLDSKKIMWLWARHAEQDTLIDRDALTILKAKQEKMDAIPDSVFQERFLIS